jgi:hypothetical protein
MSSIPVNDTIDHDDFEEFKKQMCVLFGVCENAGNDHYYSILVSPLVNICTWDRGKYMQWVLEFTREHHIDIFRTLVSSFIFTRAVIKHSIDVVKHMLPFTGVQDERMDSPLFNAIAYCYIDVVYLLIDNGARTEKCNIINARCHYQKAVAYQEQRDEKRAACSSAAIVVNCVFRRKGAPHDFALHLVKNYIWASRKEDEWLTKTNAAKRLNFNE